MVLRERLTTAVRKRMPAVPRYLRWMGEMSSGPRALDSLVTLMVATTSLGVN